MRLTSITRRGNYNFQSDFYNQDEWKEFCRSDIDIEWSMLVTEDNGSRVDYYHFTRGFDSEFGVPCRPDPAQARR